MAAMSLTLTATAFHPRSGGSPQATWKSTPSTRVSTVTSTPSTRAASSPTCAADAAGSRRASAAMNLCSLLVMAQGTVKSYDPYSKQGLVLMDGSYEELPLGPDALDGSIFRFLREGQRVIGDVEDRDGRRVLTRLRVGQDKY